MNGNRSKRLIWPETAATQVGNVFTPLSHRPSWCFDEMPWLEAGEGGWLTWPFRMDFGHRCLGTLWGRCSDECRGPLGAGHCVLGGQRQNGGAVLGTVHPWAESGPVLLGESPLPSFPLGTKAQTRVWRCLRGKFPPTRPARTCQWQSATSTGSPGPASWQEGCQGSRSDERILNHIYMCMVQKGKGRGEKPLRNTERKSLTNPPGKKKISHRFVSDVLKLLSLKALLPSLPPPPIRPIAQRKSLILP